VKEEGSIDQKLEKKTEIEFLDVSRVFTERVTCVFGQLNPPLLHDEKKKRKEIISDVSRVFTEQVTHTDVMRVSSCARKYSSLAAYVRYY